MIHRAHAGTRRPKPALGMTFAFTSTEPALAHMPARVTYIWPRFRSGDYLVTLEYARPVAVGRESIQQIDAFLSELYQPLGPCTTRSARPPWYSYFGLGRKQPH